MKNNEKMVEVYKARTGLEAQVIRSLLEGYGIPCFLKSNAAPSVHTFTMDGMGEVRVMVMESQAELARELINRDEKQGETEADGKDDISTQNE